MNDNNGYNGQEVPFENGAQNAQRVPPENAAGAGAAAYAGQPYLDIPDLPAAKPIEPEHWSRAEKVTAFVCAALGYLFTHCACHFAGGIWGGIVWLAAGVTGAVFLHKKGARFTAGQKLVFAVAVLFCLVPFYSASIPINDLAAVYSFILLAYLGVSASGAELFGRHFFPDLLLGVFVRPFESFVDGTRAGSSAFRGAKAGKNALYVLVGLIIAAPLTIVVALLLIASDAAFENAMGGFLDMLPSFSPVLIAEIFFAVPGAMYISGMMFSSAKEMEIPPERVPSYRVIPSAMVYTAVTPICLFYLVYILTQLGYFTSAFGGELPEGYSYSEFARRGFFELCVIAVINLFVIVIMQAFAKRHEDDRRPAALKAYTAVISGFTLLLIASAISKMVMYITEMGMTPLRIYTSWFMLLLAAVFMVIIVWQFVDFRVWRALFAAFTVMFGILCWGDVDGMIANYNVNAYQSGASEKFDTDVLYMLSPSAARHAVRLAGEDSRVDSYLESTEGYLYRIDSTAYFSVQRLLAENALAEINSP